MVVSALYESYMKVYLYLVKFFILIMVLLDILTLPLHSSVTAVYFSVQFYYSDYVKEKSS